MVYDLVTRVQGAAQPHNRFYYIQNMFLFRISLMLYVSSDTELIPFSGFSVAWELDPKPRTQNTNHTFHKPPSSRS